MNKDRIVCQAVTITNLKFSSSLILVSFTSTINSDENHMETFKTTLFLISLILKITIIITIEDQFKQLKVELEVKRCFKIISKI